MTSAILRTHSWQTTVYKTRFSPIINWNQQREYQVAVKELNLTTLDWNPASNEIDYALSFLLFTLITRIELYNVLSQIQNISP